MWQFHGEYKPTRSERTVLDVAEDVTQADVDADSAEDCHCRQVDDHQPPARVEREVNPRYERADDERRDSAVVEPFVKQTHVTINCWLNKKNHSAKRKHKSK